MSAGFGDRIDRAIASVEARLVPDPMPGMVHEIGVLLASARAVVMGRWRGQHAALAVREARALRILTRPTL